ncbi:MAG: ketoacyl-ACP synthase III [Desulfovibrio sp.]|jgi:3-oxoacyl-[acyl-carrier-protein] synthase-3|nr:ketoacyl-ACP synthase III [Desulfovibrio sp.]
MARAAFTDVRIAGIAAVVPKEEVRLAEEVARLGGDLRRVERLARIAGIDRRRVAPPGVTPADLCRQAARRLMGILDVPGDAIDALLFVGQHPDHILPATACILQDALGLSRDCAALDVNQGCSGYVYGLWLAFSLAACSAARRVLLLVGDGMTGLLDPENRVVAPVFGDCGTATLVERAQGAPAAWFDLGTDGSGAKDLMIAAGGARIPPPSTPEAYAAHCQRVFDPAGVPWRPNRLHMDAGAVFAFTMDTVPARIKALLASAGMTPADVHHLVLHQANRQIMANIAREAGFPESRTPMETFSRYGNQGAASIPCALCDALGEELARGPRTLLLSGYGVGLSWASAILTMEGARCAPVVDFDPETPIVAPEEELARWRARIAGAPPETRSDDTSLRGMPRDGMPSPDAGTAVKACGRAAGPIPTDDEGGMQ